MQHAAICWTLYDRMGILGAAEAERSMFIEAMCEEATCDLLCWSLDKGLGQGDAQAEHGHTAHIQRYQQLLGVLRRVSAACQVAWRSVYGLLPGQLSLPSSTHTAKTAVLGIPRMAPTHPRR